MGVALLLRIEMSQFCGIDHKSPLSSRCSCVRMKTRGSVPTLDQSTRTSRNAGTHIPWLEPGCGGLSFRKVREGSPVSVWGLRTPCS